MIIIYQENYEKLHLTQNYSANPIYLQNFATTHPVSSFLVVVAAGL